jgi:hypothetical protein
MKKVENVFEGFEPMSENIEVEIGQLTKSIFLVDG